MTMRLSPALLLCLLLTVPASAAVKPGAFSLSPLLGVQVFDSDQNLKSASALSLGFGYNLTDRATLETVISRAKADGDAATGVDSKVDGLRIDALYHFRPDQALVPYLALGAGQYMVDPDAGTNRRHLLGSLGAGLKYFLTDSLALRLDLHYLLDLPKPHQNLLPTMGITWQFGAPDTAPDAQN